MAAEATHEILTVCDLVLIARARWASESEHVMVGGKRGRSAWSGLLGGRTFPCSNWENEATRGGDLTRLCPAPKPFLFAL